MAMASAIISPATVAVVGPNRASKRGSRVNYIGGLNSFGGLKAHNNVVALGLPVSTDHSFANVISSLKKPSRGGGGGGALTSTCNAVGEIFKIAAIMNAITLVGVAIGFVLLRIEAAVEEE